MTNTKTSFATAMLSGLALCAAAGASPIVTNDPVAWSTGLAETHVESFESMGHKVTELTFDGSLSASVTITRPTKSKVIADTDGKGAVSMGAGNFWSLKDGTTTIDLGSVWDAFGFWYSDLEVATLIVSLPELSFNTQLTDNNPDVNHFFGIRSDTPFSRITIAWSGVSGDSVGFDDMKVGRIVPAPGSSALATLSVVCVAGVRWRGRKACPIGA